MTFISLIIKFDKYFLGILSNTFIGMSFYLISTKRWLLSIILLLILFSIFYIFLKVDLIFIVLYLRLILTEPGKETDREIVVQ